MAAAVALTRENQGVWNKVNSRAQDLGQEINRQRDIRENPR